MFPHQLNSKNNVPLLSVATEDKDGRGLKLEKIRPTVNAVPAKIRQKNSYLLPNSAGAFCICVKALSNDFSTELI